jgi:hypothetical protein
MRGTTLASSTSSGRLDLIAGLGLGENDADETTNHEGEGAAADGWWRSGKLCRFNRDGSLSLMGNFNTIVKINHGTGIDADSGNVNLEKLEAFYARECPLVKRIWIRAMTRDDADRAGVDGKGVKTTETTASLQPPSPVVASGDGDGSSSPVFPHGRQQSEEPAWRMTETGKYFRIDEVCNCSLVAVVCIDHESLYRAMSNMVLATSDVTAVCELPVIQTLVLSQLRRCAERFRVPALERIDSVHLIPYTFEQTHLLTNVFGTLRRRALDRHFHDVLQAHKTKQREEEQ